VELICYASRNCIEDERRSIFAQSFLLKGEKGVFSAVFKRIFGLRLVKAIQIKMSQNFNLFVYGSKLSDGGNKELSRGRNEDFIC